MLRRQMVLLRLDKCSTARYIVQMAWTEGITYSYTYLFHTRPALLVNQPAQYPLGQLTGNLLSLKLPPLIIVPL